MNGSYADAGTVTAAGFMWGSASDLSGATDSPATGTSSPFSKSLSGLTGSTTYYFSAYATIDGGVTLYGDTLSFATSAPSTGGSTGGGGPILPGGGTGGGIGGGPCTLPCYADNDGDGFGAGPSVGTSTGLDPACSCPTGQSLNNSDIDDTDDLIWN